MMTTPKALTFIESYFVDTLGSDGVIVHHIDDTEWQSLKSRILKETGEKNDKPA